VKFLANDRTKLGCSVEGAFSAKSIGIFFIFFPESFLESFLESFWKVLESFWNGCALCEKKESSNWCKNKVTGERDICKSCYDKERHKEK